MAGYLAYCLDEGEGQFVGAERWKKPVSLMSSIA